MLSAIVHSRVTASQFRKSASGFTRNKEGWDSAFVRGVVNGDESRAHTLFAYGAIHPLASTQAVYAGFRVSAIRECRPLPGAHTLVDVEFQGVASAAGRPEKMIDRTFVRERNWPKNATTGVSTLLGVPGKPNNNGDVRIQELHQGVEWYYTTTTRPTAPSSNGTGGLTQVPPAAVLPTLAPNPYTYFSPATYVWPNGWVLQDREVQSETGFSFYFVRETWVHFYNYEPGA